MMSLFTNLLVNMFRESEFDRTVRELNALSDRELADMGFSRGDIYRVAKEAEKTIIKPIEVHP